MAFFRTVQLVAIGPFDYRVTQSTAFPFAIAVKIPYLEEANMGFVQFP